MKDEFAKVPEFLFSNLHPNLQAFCASQAPLQKNKIGTLKDRLPKQQRGNMPKRILVVDDEVGIRKITQISLEVIAGWQVLSAASGQEGLEIAQTEHPDAILLDVMMPGIDGITTLQHLRENPTTQTIPVILLTAKAQISEQRQLAELSISGLITKPFKATDLVKQIQSILGWDE